MRFLNITTSVLFIFLFFFSGLKGGIYQKHEGGKKNTSFWQGIYCEKPVLDSTKVWKLNTKLENIDKQIFQLDSQRQSIESEIPDSAQVRKYINFFRGRFTIPQLTKQEKFIINKRKELKNIEIKITRLKQEQSKIHKLINYHMKYREKQLLWGFATWPVKKNDAK